jgi:ABC-type Fe3+/spermidine/putrescine transport system ATPase subunit
MSVQIAIEGVSKSYGAVRVLDDCSLSVDKGTVLTLLGPSGCGKTTLLRAIAGFVEPEAGRVRVGGRDISHLPPNRRQVGYVFQNYALFPHLTVAGNVAYGLKVRRVARAQVTERVRSALDLVALTGLADRYPAQLSGGQQQRVAIARALVLEPAVLLLDEPFNALDAALRLAMQVELRKLIERVGITSIFVTHDQAEAMALSDTVAVMKAGSIEQVAPPLEIYDRPRTAYVARFIGRANLLPVTAAGGRAEGLDGVVAAVPDGEATLVVRPENLVLRPRDAGPGWPGHVAFATPLGAQIEYEVDCGLPEPVRVLAGRRAGAAPLPSGTPVRVEIDDPAGCVVLPGQRRHDG